MKVLFFEWSGYGNDDIKSAFSELGYEVQIQEHDLKDVYHDEALEKTYKDRIESEKPDFAFSFNYYQPIAYACNDTGTPYISWVYDNPFVMLYSFTVIFPTNHIFIFDSEQYAEFARNKIPTIHYMPLAANPIGRKKLLDNEAIRNEFVNSKLKNQTDIAFVGSLYNEKHNFFDRMKKISDYTRGYLEGIMSSQKQIYGYNFVKSMMTDKLMNDMSDDLPIKPSKESVATREFMFSEYVVNREITARERQEYLKAISDRFYDGNNACLDLYTHDEAYTLPGIINHGNADHLRFAPFVYNNAGINLNITLRSIHTGIPLRAFEIIGAGGFLLTNYQNDYADCFVDGVDYVSYGSKEDMLAKIEYYLSHEKERSEIAYNGYMRVIENHTYAKRIQEMVSYL